MSTSLSRLEIVGGIVLLVAGMIGAIAVYDALADDAMMDGAWDMMDDTDGMGHRGMMDGIGHDHMMGGRVPSQAETTGTASGRGNVLIAGFTYEPTTLNVTPGTVVTWTNEDRAPHTATAENGSFDTGRLDRRESAEATLDTPGTYEYICTYHPSMQGRIVVSASPR